jgi:hypothetical protein
VKEYGPHRHDPRDDEVQILGHFEELSSALAVVAPGIKSSPAVNRHVRARKRLEDVFQGMP